MARRVDERLGRCSRIRRRAELLAVQERGHKAVSAGLVVIVLQNGRGQRRLGVTVSSRVGNAVARNRVKRRLREIFRRLRGLLPESVDAVIIARPRAREMASGQLAAEFAELAAAVGRKAAPRRG